MTSNQPQAGRVWLTPPLYPDGLTGAPIAATGGGPARATEILVFKVYNDGFRGLDLGGSAAQSAVLMAILVTLTFVQFRFIEKKVQY